MVMECDMAARHELEDSGCMRWIRVQSARSLARTEVLSYNNAGYWCCFSCMEVHKEHSIVSTIGGGTGLTIGRVVEWRTIL